MVDCLGNIASCRTAQASAQHRVQNHIRGRRQDWQNVGPCGFILNRKMFAAVIFPTLKIQSGIAAHVRRRTKKDDHGIANFLAQMSRDHKTIATVVSPSAQHRNFPYGRLKPPRNFTQREFSHRPAGIFHQFGIGNAVASSGEQVHFAHFRCGESFHKGRPFGKNQSIQPPLTLTT